MLYIIFCQKEESILLNEFLCKPVHKYAIKAILYIAKL